MTTQRHSRRFAVRIAVLAGVLVLAAAAGAVAVHKWQGRSPISGQKLSIPGQVSDAPFPAVKPAVSDPSGPPFVTAVAPGGRYLVDQYGKPLLVQGDSPWALMTRLSPQQAQTWFADRQEHGVNAAILSLIGATANGGPSDDGKTFDGLLPFRDGDVLDWQEPYWQRMTQYVHLAQEHGVTMMIYPIDGWSIGKSFVPTSIDQCTQYGRKLAARFAAFPNIVWLSGGDYFPATDDLAAGSDVDHCIDATVRGLRAGGDTHLFSMQLGYDRSVSTENPYWSSRVDWNFVYSYYPTYRAVLDAYARAPHLPAVLGESNYEGENNDEDTPGTTNLTLRRQVLWALTSGAAGDFMGSRDWRFDDPGWSSRLDTPAVRQLQQARALVTSLPWWKMVPDIGSHLVTGGRGQILGERQAADQLQNDYVTASSTPDGSTALVYFPAAHTITIDRSRLAAGVRAEWIDPVSGARTSAPVTGQWTTPGTNAGGDHDWLLLLRAP